MIMRSRNSALSRLLIDEAFCSGCGLSSVPSPFERGHLVSLRSSLPASRQERLAAPLTQHRAGAHCVQAAAVLAP